MSAEVTARPSRARDRIRAAASPPMNSGPPRWRWVAAAMSSQGASSGPYVAFAPTTWNAGRSPVGRIGRTLADVWTSARRTSSEVSTPSRSSSRSSMSPTGSVPTAPALRAFAPSLARTSDAPPADPAAVILISSTSWPPCPSGISSTGRTSTSRTCTPITIAVISESAIRRILSYRAGRAVPALHRRRNDRLPLLLVERANLAERPRAPVDVAGPLEQQRVVDGHRKVGRERDRAVVRHQGGGPPVERLDHRLGELRSAERPVGSDADSPAEQQHLVVDARQLVLEDTGERGGHRRVRVDDRARVVAAVDPEMQVELRRRRELARDYLTVEVDHGHLVRCGVRKHGTGRADRDVLA